MPSLDGLASMECQKSGYGSYISPEVEAPAGHHLAKSPAYSAECWRGSSKGQLPRTSPRHLGLHSCSWKTLDEQILALGRNRKSCHLECCCHSAVQTGMSESSCSHCCISLSCQRRSSRHKIGHTCLHLVVGSCQLSSARQADRICQKLMVKRNRDLSC